MPKPRQARRATPSPRILTLLRLVRTQIDELRRLLEPLPMTDPVDAECVARINTALRLAQKLLAREKAAAFVGLLPEHLPVDVAMARLAVVQAHGAVLAFVQRYGFYRPSLEMWLLPGEVGFVPGHSDDRDDDFDDDY